MNRLTGLGALYKMATNADKLLPPAPKAVQQAAVSRIAETPATNWGWKGPKRGEISGTEFVNRYSTIDRAARDKLLEDVASQLRPLAPAGKESLSPGRVLRTMTYLSNLEKADVPREFTGKIIKAAVKDSRGIDEGAAQKFSNALANLTPTERETFLGLLPGWVGSIDELAFAARSL